MDAAAIAVPGAGSDLLGYRDIAAITGISEGTLRNYRRRGYMPPPDVMLADRPRWTRSSIDHWLHLRKIAANEKRN